MGNFHSCIYFTVPSSHDLVRRDQVFRFDLLCYHFIYSLRTHKNAVVWKYTSTCLKYLNKYARARCLHALNEIYSFVRKWKCLRILENPPFHENALRVHENSFASLKENLDGMQGWLVWNSRYENRDTRNVIAALKLLSVTK